MKRWMRFRLRTLLVMVTLLAVFLAFWPRYYDWRKWSPIEAELESWLAKLELSTAEPRVVNHIYGRARVPLLFSIRNFETNLPNGSEIKLPLADQLYITGPNSLMGSIAQRVDTKQEALKLWKREYLEEHGWRWW
jgi:hypothetical protein